MSDVSRLLSWFAAGELVRPAGDVPGPVDLSLALAHLCGATVEVTPQAQRIATLIGGAKHIVFVMLDGFGMPLVERQPPDGIFRRRLAMEMHTVFPSSTAPALTSLATGRWPAEHAVPGWWTYLPDAGLTATILPFHDRFSDENLDGRIAPTSAFPVPSLQRAYARRRLAVMPQTIAGSVYSRYSSDEGAFSGYASLTAAAERIARHVRESAAPTYTYFYVPYIDGAAHRSGPEHGDVQRAIGRAAKRLAQLAEALPADARIVVSADHGLIEVPRDARHTLDRHDALVRLLRVPPTCEPRTPAFHVRDGQQATFAALFRERWADRFALLTVDEADELRLFGKAPLSTETRRRLGDFVAVARGLDAIVYEPSDELRAMRGFHGGLHPDEMRIPLIVI